MKSTDAPEPRLPEHGWPSHIVRHIKNCCTEGLRGRTITRPEAEAIRKAAIELASCAMESIGPERLPDSARLSLAEDNGRIRERLRVLDVVDSFRESHPDDGQVLDYLREVIVND